jgi:lipid-A-disaccharide synthase
MEARRSGIQQSQFQNKKKEKHKLIILLPGSRKREIAYMLPVMLEAVKDLKGYSIYIAGAPSVASGFYYRILQENKANGVSLTTGYTYHLLQQASAAICTSGTATLETALFNVPQVVCYKGDRISYHIAKKLVKVPYIAMVNLISGKEVVKELIQDDFNATRVRTELEEILKPERRAEILSHYAELHSKLETGDPAMKVATLLISSLKRN